MLLRVWWDNGVVLTALTALAIVSRTDRRLLVPIRKQMNITHLAVSRDGSAKTIRAVGGQVKFAQINANQVNNNNNQAEGLQQAGNHTTTTTTSTMRQQILQGMATVNSTSATNLIRKTRRKHHQWTKPRQRTLPTMERAGVVLFFHSPKTGGSTIRENFMQFEKVKVLRVFFFERQKGFESIKAKVNGILSGRRKMVLLVELHGTCPGITPERSPSLAPLIADWRNQSLHSGVPFFTTTLVREPVAFHVSYFVMFHLKSCMFKWCERDLYEATEEGLLQSIFPNKQCAILSQGQLFRGRYKQQVSPLDCRQVYHGMLHQWDWVGTTEQLSTHTLPLLAHVLLQNVSLVQQMNNAKAETHPAKTKLGRLSDATKQRIQELSSLDVELYQSVQRAYTLEKWRRNVLL